jgi:hypothetical protein
MSRTCAADRRPISATVLLEADVLVVVARGGLGGRREDRLRQRLAFVRPGGRGTPQTTPLSRYSFQPEPAR